MNRLFFFNPDNDLALAAGVAQFTPPANPLALRQSGALLPIWWADENDYVLVESIPDKEIIDRFRKKFGLKAQVITKVPENVADDLICCPWGWSANSRLIFKKAGAKNLPSDENLERLRQLSHRRFSIEVNRRLRDNFGIETPPLPKEVISAEEVMNLLDSQHDYIAKSPWSSSGRGMAQLSSMSKNAAISFVSGVISRQGSVILEKTLNKILDFAMLFESDEKGVKFIGYSVFSTNANGGYSSNIVANDSTLKSMLTKYITASKLDNIKSSLESVLSDSISGVYLGPLGVDMMVYSDCGQTAVAPTIEVNLRMTMGIVAHYLASRFADNDNMLDFIVAPTKSNINKEKTISLIPVFSTTRFTFNLAIKS